MWCQATSREPANRPYMPVGAKLLKRRISLRSGVLADTRACNGGQQLRDAQLPDRDPLRRPRGRMAAGAGLTKSLKTHEARPKIARCIRHRMGEALIVVQVRDSINTSSPLSRRRTADGGRDGASSLIVSLPASRPTTKANHSTRETGGRSRPGQAFCRQYEAASRVPASSTQDQGQPSTIEQSLEPTDRSHHRHGHIVQTLGADEFDPVWAIAGRFTPSACYSTVLSVSAFQKFSPSTHTWPKSGGAFLAADGRQLGRLNKRKQRDDDQAKGHQIALGLPAGRGKA